MLYKKNKRIFILILKKASLFFLTLSIVTSWSYGFVPAPLSNFSPSPKSAEATLYPSAKVIFLTTTGTNTWTVPSDWSDDNKIEVLGAGGGGGAGSTAGSGGGGGGAYSSARVTGLSPGGSVTYRVGAGGPAGTAGGDTFFNRTGGSANTCADTVSVCAKGGSGASSATGAAGGALSGNKPANVGFPGGSGGSGNNTGDTGGGGGGASGPNGAGANGGGGQAAAPGAGGGGGGSSVGTNGSVGSTNGGAGGANFRGAGAGTGANATTNTAATAGTFGGGGGGGAATTTATSLRAGANGGAGAPVWTSTHAADGVTPSVADAGPGGGGGGAGATTGNGTGSVAGNGGNYGAGGGGGYTTAGTGAQGIIVITYVPSSITYNTVFLTSTGTNTWTVPSDWSDINEVYTLGAGGGGRAGTSDGSGGGGGGAVATGTVTGLSPGGSVTYRVGAGGPAGTAGGDTFFNRTGGSANTCADTVSVCAKGGSGATSATGAAGGAIVNNKPAYSGYAGGNGGTGNTTGDTGGGGGGAAGPYGRGKNAGAGQGASPGAGGGGGGVGGIGSTGATNGGAAGVNFDGSGAGVGANATTNTAATAGTFGGGGGGGAATTTATSLRAGANGSNSAIWTQTSDSATIGPGGGGGGAGAQSGSGTGAVGGNGGYGGGGGGSYQTPGTGGQGFIVIRYRSKQVVLGDGTDPGNSTIGPGASATEIDRFTLSTTLGTDTVTGMTVTLGGGVNAYENIGSVEIRNTGDQTLCSNTSISSNTVNLTSCGISVNTVQDEYRVMIVPKSHANMPAVPGASYGVTATVTSVTATNSFTGTDTDSATITVDNLSPTDVTSANTSAGNASVTLSWTNPADSDLSRVMVLASTSAVTFVPTEGATYSTSTLVGNSRVACYGLQTSCVDLGLSNGTAYHYRIYTLDTRGNWSTPGVIPTGSPVTPDVPGIDLSGTVYVSEGGSNIGAGKQIRVYKNGSTLAASDTTDSSGGWSVTSAEIDSGDVVTVYIDGDDIDGNTVFVSDGTDQTNIDVFGGVLLVRHDTGSNITNANLSTGYVSGDALDMEYTVSGSDLTLANDVELHVYTGDTYAPGGSVTTQGSGDIHVDDNATATFSSGTITIADDLVIDNGATVNLNTNTNVNGGSILTSGTATLNHTAGTPTVTISGTGTLGGGSNELTFYNLSVTGTVNSSNSITIKNNVTVSSTGSLVFSSGTATLQNGSSISNSGTLTFSALTIPSSATVTTSSGFTVSGGLTISSSATFSPSAGTITLSGGTLANSGTLNFYNLNISSGTVSTSATFGVSNNLSISSGTLSTSGGTITVIGDLSVSGTLSGTATVTVNGGDVTGEGTVNLTSGIFTLNGNGSFGGGSAWNFNRLVFGSGSASLVDSYPTSNFVTGLSLYSTYFRGWAQSFTSTGGALDSAQFYLYKAGSPTGNAVAKLYAHSGTYGTNGVPTGAALATSDNFDVSALTDSPQLITFNFSGANRFQMTDGAKYFISIEYSGGNASNRVVVGYDSTSPNHSGNRAEYYSSWGIDGIDDLIFYVYSSGSTNSIGTGSITSATTTVSAGQTLNGGTNKTWILTAPHEPFQLLGSFNANTSSFRYTASSNATVTPTTYFNLELSPSSGSPTYRLGSATSQSISVGGNFVIGGAGNLTVDANSYDPTIDIDGSLTIGASDTWSASNISTLTVGGSITNNGTFTSNNGTVVLDTQSTSIVSSNTTIQFFNLSVTSPGKTVQFSNHTADVPTFEFFGQLTITGTITNPVFIESSLSGNQWRVDFKVPQTNITYASIKDSACAPGSFSVTFSPTNSGRANNGSCWNINNSGAAANQAVNSAEQGTGGGVLRTGGGSHGGSSSSESGSGGGTGQTGGGQGGGVGGGGVGGGTP